jgi:hypothetical protein
MFAIKQFSASVILLQPDPLVGPTWNGSNRSLRGPNHHSEVLLRHKDYLPCGPVPALSKNYHHRSNPSLFQMVQMEPRAHRALATVRLRGRDRRIGHPIECSGLPCVPGEFSQCQSRMQLHTNVLTGEQASLVPGPNNAVALGKTSRIGRQ